MRCYLVIAILAAFAACSVHAWGTEGHTATGLVAQSLLNNNAAAKLSTILGGQSLGDVAGWADDVKHTTAYAWSASLHFINTPDVCNFDYARDCVNDWCVAGAIFNYTKRLQTAQSRPDEAAKFLVHFVGDIHQPLHVSFASDRGGNTIKGYYYDSSVNLHLVWDVSLIQTRIQNDYNGDNNQWYQYLVTKAKGQMARRSRMLPSSQERPFSLSLTDPNTWASESVKLACSYSYVNTDGTTRLTSGFSLSDDYYNRNLPIVEQQVIDGGMRLAALLNSIFP